GHRRRRQLKLCAIDERAHRLRWARSLVVVTVISFPTTGRTSQRLSSVFPVPAPTPPVAEGDKHAETFSDRRTPGGSAHGRCSADSGLGGRRRAAYRRRARRHRGVLV